jgi:hypothetical protein
VGLLRVDIVCICIISYCPCLFITELVLDSAQCHWEGHNQDQHMKGCRRDFPNLLGCCPCAMCCPIWGFHSQPVQLTPTPVNIWLASISAKWNILLFIHIFNENSNFFFFLLGIEWMNHSSSSVQTSQRDSGVVIHHSEDLQKRRLQDSQNKNEAYWFSDLQPDWIPFPLCK